MTAGAQHAALVLAGCLVDASPDERREIAEVLANRIRVKALMDHTTDDAICVFDELERAVKMERYVLTPRPRGCDPVSGE